MTMNQSRTTILTSPSKYKNTLGRNTNLEMISIDNSLKNGQDCYKGTCLTDYRQLQYTQQEILSGERLSRMIKKDIT